MHAGLAYWTCSKIDSDKIRAESRKDPLRLGCSSIIKIRLSFGSLMSLDITNLGPLSVSNANTMGVPFFEPVEVSYEIGSDAPVGRESLVFATFPVKVALVVFRIIIVLREK